MVSDVITGFPPIARADARILVLGSMPSEESLRLQQYYAHPRNAFWPMMMSLLGASPEMDYRDRLTVLLDRGIAVWDTLKTCARAGSLDSAIIDASIEVNDFEQFFARHASIRHVFFNGRKSEQVFRKHVLHNLPQRFRSLEFHLLPSSSPAMASLTMRAKTERWRLLVDKLSAP